MSDIKTSLVKAAKTDTVRSKAGDAVKVAVGIGLGYSIATFGLFATGLGVAGIVVYKGWRWIKKKTPSKDSK